MFFKLVFLLIYKNISLRAMPDGIYCIIGSSPTEFTLVDYPTMDELEKY